MERSSPVGVRPSGIQTERGKATTQEPREYARRITEYSQLTSSASLFAGGHFENLAAYLNRPLRPRAPNVTQTHDGDTGADPFTFVTLYDLDPTKERRAKHLSDIENFETEVTPLIDNSKHGHILFLRGHPSPEWLLSIGTKYQVDPEYFQRYLDFFLGQPENYPLPALPSTALPMIKLRMTTIGESKKASQTAHSEADIQKLQRDALAEKKVYREMLRKHEGCKLGDSILRECSVHDLYHFSLEQDILVNVCRTKNSWACLVWIDVGNALQKGPTSPLSAPLPRKNEWEIRYLPTIQYKAGVSLRSRSKLLAPVSSAQRVKTNMAQSSSLLHLDYGRSLDRHVIAQDSFYAMHELFMFAAFSESQFLNLVASKLESELEHSALVWQKSAALSNLVYHQQILDRHIHQLRENLASVDEAIGSYLQHDLQPDNNKLPPALAAAKRLRTDYQSLVDRASKLLRYCDRGVQIVMNNAMIKESREAIHQAKGVVKLTRLAFVFIPLSFTTSFFGMNFKQLNSEALGIWIWFVVSLPILAMAVLLMQYDVSLIWHSRKRDARSTTKLSPHAAVHEV